MNTKVPGGAVTGWESVCICVLYSYSISTTREARFFFPLLRITLGINVFCYQLYQIVIGSAVVLEQPDCYIIMASPHYCPDIFLFSRPQPILYLRQQGGGLSFE